MNLYCFKCRVRLVRIDLDLGESIARTLLVCPSCRENKTGHLDVAGYSYDDSGLSMYISGQAYELHTGVLRAVVAAAKAHKWRMGMYYDGERDKWYQT